MKLTTSQYFEGQLKAFESFPFEGAIESRITLQPNHCVII